MGSGHEEEVEYLTLVNALCQVLSVEELHHGVTEFFLCPVTAATRPECHVGVNVRYNPMNTAQQRLINCFLYIKLSNILIVTMELFGILLVSHNCFSCF